MVVDDNPGDVYLVQFWLERLGCKVTVAEDGNQAVAQCKEGSFDFIFMDLDMPHLDGKEAATQIRAQASKYQQRQPAIIALTGLGLDELPTNAKTSAWTASSPNQSSPQNSSGLSWKPSPHLKSLTTSCEVNANW